MLVVAERELFTPCGACLDWIFQFGGPGCHVAFQAARDREPVLYTAGVLMPHYPR
jgi:cytidine deaminase